METKAYVYVEESSTQSQAAMSYFRFFFKPSFLHFFFFFLNMKEVLSFVSLRELYVIHTFER